MKKRVLSMLLVMLLVFSLLPAAALAAVSDPINPAPVQDEKDALHMTKNLIANGDGTYKVVIEAWATGQVDVHTITEAVPTDFVMVLDQSGSMNFPMDENASVTAAKLYEAAGNKDGKTGYTYEGYDEYYDVYIRKNNGGSYTAYYTDGWGNNHNIFSNKQGSYSTSDIYLSRVAALKTAANSFVTLVKEKADEEEGQDSNYRVAIVGFSSSGYSTHKQVISNFKDVSDAGAADLRTAIGTVTANGGTDPQGGLDKAKDLLDARTDKTYTKADGTTAYRNTVVIFFTDGHPGNNDTADMIASANNAVDSAYKLKHNNVYPVTIFSIGVFSDGDDQPLTFASSSSYARNRPNYTGKTSGGYYLLRGNAVSTNPHNDTIADYMKAVSSEYPDAKNFLNHSDNDQRNGTDKNNRGAKDNNTYYTLASNSAALEAAFTQVASSITDPSTQTNLTEEAVLKDTIYTRDFDVSNATVSAETRKITWANDQVNEVAGTAQPMPDSSITETVNTTGEVAVSGFDYSTNYCTEGHDGKKLVITIDGITPKVAGNLFSNSVNAAIYPDNTSLTPALDIVSPKLVIDTKESYVIDFNAKVELLSGAKLGYSTKNNGEFSEQTNNIYYQYNKQSMAGESANLVMNGVDTAMVLMNADKSWKQLSAIPANNIYFDDALQDVTLEYCEDGPGYNERVTSTAASTVSAIADNQVLLYTFRGTGIDIYCTTNADGGYVQAGLMTGDSADAANLYYYESADGKYYLDAESNEYIRIDDDHPAPEGATLYDSSLLAVRNYSITPEGADRYNVPTVSYTGLPYGTYTVRIKAIAGANYKLDGVRIYNAMANNETVYDGTIEANASFYNLREALVNDGQNVTVKKDDGTEKMSVYLEGQEDASEVLPGVLFIDKADSVLLEKTVVDEDGNVIRDENGYPRRELVYQNAFEAYKANGPKNEIYLAKGQGIAFTISEDAMGDHYWLGMSVPDAGSEAAVVTVNNETVKPAVASAVDMYYPITPDEDGTVVIVNQGDSMVALTNLKVTADQGDNNRVEGPGPFKSAAPFAKLSAKTLSIAATSANAVETDDGGSHTIQDLIVKLITDFVRNLFNSIARLFGK